MELTLKELKTAHLDCNVGSAREESDGVAVIERFQAFIFYGGAEAVKHAGVFDGGEFRA